MSEKKDYYHLNVDRLEIESVFFKTEVLKKAKQKTTKKRIDYQGYPYTLSIEDNGFFGEGTYFIIKHDYLEEPVFGFRIANIQGTPLLDILHLIKKRYDITTCNKRQKGDK